MEKHSANATELQHRQYFVMGDPLTRAIVHLGLCPSVATLLIVVLLNLPILVVAGIDGHWFSTPGRVGLFSDYAWWGFQALFVPAVIYYFLWMARGIPAVIEQLVSNKVISDPKTGEGQIHNIAEFYAIFGRWYSHWFWAFVSVAGNLIIGMPVGIPVHQAFKTWETAGPMPFALAQVFWIIIYSLLVLAVIRYFIAVIFFNVLFSRFWINVRVLHPDGAGGLSPLSTFTTTTGYMIGIFGLMSVWAMLAESNSLGQGFTGLTYNASIILLQALYVALSPVAFFAPIAAAHASMTKAKEDFVLEIADQFDAHLASTRETLKSDILRAEKSMTKLAKLTELHKTVTAFPVWPFNTENLVRFFSAVLFPIAIALIPSIIEKLFQ